MSKPYSVLREKMEPAACKKAAERMKSLAASMHSEICSEINDVSVQARQFKDIAAKEENNSPST